MNLLGIDRIPDSVAAFGWIPFAAVILLTLLFAGLYVKTFWSYSEKNICIAIASVLGITVALLAAFILPVDVFLVSYMKNPNGTFKDWATNETRQTIETDIAFTYYSLYGIICFFSFFVLPLCYFIYEERDEDRTSVNYFWNALIYTFVFLLVISALFMVGAFIQYGGNKAFNSSSSDWDKVKFIINELKEERGKNALSFVVHSLILFGMLNLMMYTGVGLSSFPVTLIKGFRPLSEEEMILSENRVAVQSKINSLRNKASLSSRETTRLTALEEEENLISRRSQILESEKRSFCYKLMPVIRTANAVFGVFGVLFSFILVISLLITNIDKLMYSLGYEMGYTLQTNTLFNPLDFIMNKAQKFFPLDYVLFFAITIYLVMCTVSGMRYLGVGCLCIRMYKIRPKRTPPQGLIMLSFILMFTVMAFHIITYSVMPSYSTFGNQWYCAPSNTSGCDLKQCSLTAPPEECIMTRSAIFLLSFAYKAWIFSVTYFWLSWGFLGIFFISFVVVLVRSRRSYLEEAVDKDDFDDSYDESMIRA